MQLGRILLPLVTPFKRDGNVDYKKMEQLVDWILGAEKADSIIVTGTTGEFFNLSFDERVRLIEVVKGAVSGRVPVIAGVGSASTWETIALTKQAEKKHVDAIMVVVPYYSRPTQEGLYQHFKSVARSTSLPMLIYNIPLFTGTNIEPDTLARLARLHNIIGIKEESGINPTQATRFILKTPRRFGVYVGDDAMALAVLAQGGVGVVSGGSHVVGREMRRMINSFFSGRILDAIEIHLQLSKFFDALTLNGRTNPIPLLRAAIEVSGFPVGNPRPPLTPATRKERKIIERIIEELPTKLQYVLSNNGDESLSLRNCGSFRG